MLTRTVCYTTLCTCRVCLSRSCLSFLICCKSGSSSVMSSRLTSPSRLLLLLSYPISSLIFLCIHHSVKNKQMHFSPVIIFNIVLHIIYLLYMKHHHIYIFRVLLLLNGMNGCRSMEKTVRHKKIIQTRNTCS